MPGPTRYVRRYHFFSGKGGVGKTVLACAYSVHLAAAGKRTLLVSTDPASNLGDVFETQIGHHETELAPNLWGVEIDPDLAAEEFREKVVGPMRGVMPPDIIKVLEEQFRSACTVEIAAFDRFTDYLVTTSYDDIVLDTAPTGHTIRLLELPVDWSKYIERSAGSSGQTCVGPVSSIQENQAKYREAVAVLRDEHRTTFHLVARPEKTPVVETIRAHGELAKLGITNFRLFVNGVIPQEALEGGPFESRIASQEFWTGQLRDSLPYPIQEVQLRSREIKGLRSLSLFASSVFDGDGAQPAQAVLAGSAFDRFASPAEWKRLVGSPERNKIFVFAGKGGVGKTVVATASAVKLARDGFKTLLVTTDPAAHIGQVLGADVTERIGAVDSVPGLHAVRIDQKSAVEQYKRKIVGDAEAKGYSPEMLIALREELESPCTEEMAVFDQFSAFVEQAEFARVVFDTAPTGHTLRLLELPYDYARQVEMLVEIRKDDVSVHTAKERLDKLLHRLKDPEATAFFLVLLPEYTPIFEGSRASEDLKQTGISFQAVVANFCVRAEDCHHPFFKDRFWMQQDYLRVAQTIFDGPIFSLPMLSSEVVGLEALGRVIEELF